MNDRSKEILNIGRGLRKAMEEFFQNPSEANLANARDQLDRFDNFWSYVEVITPRLVPPSKDKERVEKLGGSIKQAGSTGLSLTQIKRQVFGGRVPSATCQAVIKHLLEAGLIERKREGTKPNETVYVWAGRSE